MNTISGFGMDTITLNGSLSDKLQAMRGAGFEHVMLMARDLVSHPGGVDAAVQTLRDSGITLHFSEIKGPLMDKLLRTDFLKNLQGQVFASSFQAVRTLAPELL